MEKHLGKLANVRFGYGGYQDAMFGFSCQLDMHGSGVADFKGAWRTWHEHCKWTVEDQCTQFGETIQWLIDIMKQAKVTEVHELNGIPVEVTLEGNCLKEWRILEEVI